MAWLLYVYVAVGGAAGAVARFAISRYWAQVAMPGEWPWATFAINVVGSLLLGVMVALHTESSLSARGIALLGVGFCGGFTTFSTFSVEGLHLLQAGKPGLAALYVAASCALGVFAAWLGWRLVQLNQ